MMKNWYLMRAAPSPQADVRRQTRGRVAVRFIRKEIDVLICTTIIESGVTYPTPTPSSLIA